MSKEKNVIKYYVLCNKLKNVIRTGWKDWNVKRARIESIAEHIFGVQMLAIGVFSEYKYDIDISKVIMMLALHELEEIIIGDLTLFDIAKDEKKRLGHEAIEKILDGLVLKEEIKNLIFEFDERTTPEALYAYHCDKLECDIQCKIYDEEGCVELNNQLENKSFFDPDVQLFLNEGKTWSDMWLSFGQKRYNYDENFTKISNYVKDHTITKNI